MRAYVFSDRIADRAVMPIEGGFCRIDVPRGANRWFYRESPRIDTTGYAEVELAESAAAQLVGQLRQLSGKTPLIDVKAEDVGRMINTTFGSYWTSMRVRD